MGVRYPQERRGDERAKGGQPYADAKEAMAESEAEIQDNADQHPVDNSDLTEEERNALQEQAAEERFAEIGEDEDQKSPD